MTNPIENITVAEAAEKFRVTPDTVHAWRKRAHILATELPNGRFLIPVSEVERITGAKVKTEVPKHQRRYTVTLPGGNGEGE